MRPTSSRSLCLPPARAHFCELTARAYGGTSSPTKYGLNGTMPGHREHDRRIVRDQAGRRHDGVVLRGEEVDERLSQAVGGDPVAHRRASLPMGTRSVTVRSATPGHADVAGDVGQRHEGANAIRISTESTDMVARPYGDRSEWGVRPRRDVDRHSVVSAAQVAASAPARTAQRRRGGRSGRDRRRARRIDRRFVGGARGARTRV